LSNVLNELREGLFERFFKEGLIAPLNWGLGDPNGAAALELRFDTGTDETTPPQNPSDHSLDWVF
jgi:hypothetical protein